MTDWTQVPVDHKVWFEGEEGTFYFRGVEKDGRLRLLGGRHKMRSWSVDPARVSLRTTQRRPKASA